MAGIGGIWRLFGTPPQLRSPSQGTPQATRSSFPTPSLSTPAFFQRLLRSPCHRIQPAQPQSSSVSERMYKFFKIVKFVMEVASGRRDESNNLKDKSLRVLLLLTRCFLSEAMLLARRAREGFLSLQLTNWSKSKNTDLALQIMHSVPQIDAIS